MYIYVYICIFIIYVNIFMYVYIYIFTLFIYLFIRMKGGTYMSGLDQAQLEAQGWFLVCPPTCLWKREQGQNRS